MPYFQNPLKKEAEQQKEIVKNKDALKEQDYPVTLTNGTKTTLIFTESLNELKNNGINFNKTNGEIKIGGKTLNWKDSFKIFNKNTLFTVGFSKKENDKYLYIASSNEKTLHELEWT